MSFVFKLQTWHVHSPSSGMCTVLKCEKRTLLEVIELKISYSAYPKSIYVSVFLKFESALAFS